MTDSMTTEQATMLVNAVATATARNELFGEYFQSQDSKRSNAWQSYGWPNTLTPDALYSMYSRSGIATNGCDAVVDMCWMTPPCVSTSEDPEPTAWDKEFKALAKRLRLFNRLKGLDRRQRVGRFAGAVMFVKDGKKLDQPLKGKYSADKLVGIKPYFESQMKAVQWDQDEKSPRYGEPTVYQINENNLGDKSDIGPARSTNVHWSRVIVWAEGSDDGSVYGTPALEAPFNALLTLELLQGAGGEAFFKNAKNTPAIKFDKDLKINDVMAYLGVTDPTKIPEALQDAVSEYNRGLDKSLAIQGAEFKAMPVTLPNPKEFYDMTLDIAAAGFKTPRNILIGSQTGVLAGDKDSMQFAKTSQARRETFINPCLEDTVDRFVELGFLPAYDELFVTWEPLIEDSESDKLERAEKMAKINQLSIAAQLDQLFTDEEIRDAAGYPPEIELEDDDGEMVDDEELGDE